MITINVWAILKVIGTIFVAVMTLFGIGVTLIMLEWDGRFWR